MYYLIFLWKKFKVSNGIYSKIFVLDSNWENGTIFPLTDLHSINRKKVKKNDEKASTVSGSEDDSE